MDLKPVPPDPCTWFHRNRWRWHFCPGWRIEGSGTKFRARCRTCPSRPTNRIDYLYQFNERHLY